MSTDPASHRKLGYENFSWFCLVQAYAARNHRFASTVAECEMVRSYLASDAMVGLMTALRWRA